MLFPRVQNTIAASTCFEGIGYWSGRNVRVELHPASADTGILFRRVDLSDRPIIAATVANRTDIPLRTRLEAGGGRVDMVEHIMAALAGLRIDNCEVHIDCEETPGLDGSAHTVVEAIDRVGIRPQIERRKTVCISRPIRIEIDQDCWIEARPSPLGQTILRYELDYPAVPAIGRQTYQLTLTPETFRSNLATARTFLTEAEARHLQSQGLGEHASFDDLLVYGEDGPIGNELRYADECVRHKLLDMVGDLALAGCDIVGYVVAHRTGHHQNAQLVRKILASESESESSEGETTLRRTS